MPAKPKDSRATARHEEIAVQLCDALLAGKELQAGKLLSRYADVREVVLLEEALQEA